jgi:ribose transport system substrate-binding protein
MTRDAFRPLIGTAHQNGAIVINPYIEVLDDTDCYVGSLDSLTAVAAAKKTIELLGGKGKVATAQGTLASKMNYYRCGVFKEYIEANSEIEVVMEMPCEWMPEKGMQMTQDLLTTTPDLGLVWCANDGLAMGVIEGVRKADKTDTCLVLSMDGTSVALDAVKKGELQGTYFNDPHGLSGIAVEIAVRELAGQKLPKVVETPVTLIDASNVDQYLKK